ncbi:MAG: hypothetical protein ACW98K_08570 [Candidatus Kariarchaeaceae archaeon]|jgi:tellurite resistance protein
MADLEKIWQKLQEVALRDNIITIEEEEIIESVIKNVEKFEKVLGHALEDGNITIDEKKQLETARKRIIDEAYDIAVLDDHVPPEEERLLRTIATIVKGMKSHLNE